ncbi:hypothetical protein [Gaetbulibacter jejuensis]|uniref:hypothetical protein n=1 Tax=Gaetbulibacter jejuensis TaxID=584607 RepID=UPI003009A34B
MKLEDLKKVAEPYVEIPHIDFEININLFREINGRENFNQLIRNNVAKKFGVYIWVNADTDEIIYIGMAGKVKTNGNIGNHTLQNRLLASRGREKITKKDILTNDYVFNFMQLKNIESLKFHIMYSKKEIPPTYIESLILYEYYKNSKKLPELNNSF